MFREGALEQSAGPDPVDEAMGVIASAGWLQLSVLGLLVLIAVVWSALTDIPIKAKAKGILLGGDGVAEITLASHGRIIDMHVRPGDLVKEGDLIAVVGQPDLRTQLAVKEASLRETQDRERQLIGFDARSADAQAAVAASKMHAAEERIRNLTDRQRWLQERDRNFEDLLARGYVAKDAVLKNKAELSQVMDQIAGARSEITAARNDLRLQEVQRQKELTSVQEDIVRLTAELEETKRLLTTTREVRSPYSGRVIEVKYGQGEYVEVGQPMVSLVRSDSDGNVGNRVVAVIFVPSQYGKEVTPGMRVDVSPTSVPSNEYGFIIGKVTSVSEAPATSAGMMRILKNDQMVKQLSQEGPPFEVEVELQTAPTRSGFAWTSSMGPGTAVSAGTPCDAGFIIREERLLGLVVPPLARLFAK